MNEPGKDTVIPEEKVETENNEDTIEQEEVDNQVEEKEAEDASNEDEELVDLQKELDALTEENKKLTDRMLRLQAEYENYKRRTEKEKIAERKYKAQDLAVELLPIIDNFERALQTEVSEENKSFLEGMQMIYQQLQTALESQGIEKIDAVNKEFDPNMHHAVMQVEEEDMESNIVVEELQTGYMLKDKVIRPAMVKVNK
mgnify:CR=1 FL=1